MSLFNVLLVVHILGAFMIVAGAGTATALGISTSRTASTSAITAMSGLTHVVERYVIVPGALLAIVFGSWLVSEAGYDFGQAWLIASYASWIVAMGLATGVMTPRIGRLHRQAAQLVAQGVAESEELRRQADDPVLRNVGLLLDLLLLLFIYLMVVRPGA